MTDHPRPVIPFTEHERWYVDTFLSKMIQTPARRWSYRFWRRVARADRHEQRSWRQYAGWHDGAAWPRRRTA